MIRAQILIEEVQYNSLRRIAAEEKRSLSDIIRDLLGKQLQVYKQNQMARAAEALYWDYVNDTELIAFTSLDGEDWHATL